MVRHDEGLRKKKTMSKKKKTKKTNNLETKGYIRMVSFGFGKVRDAVCVLTILSQLPLSLNHLPFTTRGSFIP